MSWIFFHNIETGSSVQSERWKKRWGEREGNQSTLENYNEFIRRRDTEK